MIALATSTLASTSLADLSDDAARVAEAWQRAGVEVERAAPLFVERDRSRRLSVETDGSADPSRCTTVTFLSERDVSFSVLMEGAVDAAGADPSVRSVAGMVALERCGSERSTLRALTVSVNAERAAVEALIGRGEHVVAPDVVLDERRPGREAPAGDPGPGPSLGPLPVRAAEAERRSRADGAARVGSSRLRASMEGDGSQGYNLVAGCHRIDLLVETPAGVRVDMDGDLYDVDGGRLLARDRGAAPDVRLQACVGASTRTQLRFAGAPSDAELILVDAVWPIPAGIPTHWGERAHAGFAAGMRRAGAPAVSEAPILESLGGQGSTWVPLAITPGACYLAAVGMVHGEEAGLALSTIVEGTEVRDIVADRAEGAALSFCSDRATTARVRVLAQGGHPWWAFGLWELVGP